MGNRKKLDRKKLLSPAEIHALRGKFKMNTGGKPFAKWWAEHKREEIELEERKLRRLAGRKKK